MLTILKAKKKSWKGLLHLSLTSSEFTHPPVQTTFGFQRSFWVEEQKQWRAQKQGITYDTEHCQDVMG